MPRLERRVMVDLFPRSNIRSLSWKLRVECIGWRRELEEMFLLSEEDEMENGIMPVPAPH